MLIAMFWMTEEMKLGLSYIRFTVPSAFSSWQMPPCMGSWNLTVHFISPFRNNVSTSWNLWPCEKSDSKKPLDLFIFFSSCSDADLSQCAMKFMQLPYRDSTVASAVYCKDILPKINTGSNAWTVCLGRSDLSGEFSVPQAALLLYPQLFRLLLACKLCLMQGKGSGSWPDISNNLPLIWLSTCMKGKLVHFIKTSINKVFVLPQSWMGMSNKTALIQKPQVLVSILCYRHLRPYFTWIQTSPISFATLHFLVNTSLFIIHYFFQAHLRHKPKA